MSAATLLVELRALGVKLEAHGDRLKCRGPAANLTPELTERMRLHKAELLAELERAANDSNGSNGSTPVGGLADFDPATASPGWLLHYPDRDPEQVYFSPPTTLAEVLALYHGAIGAEPLSLARE